MARAYIYKVSSTLLEPRFPGEGVGARPTGYDHPRQASMDFRRIFEMQD